MGALEANPGRSQEEEDRMAAYAHLLGSGGVTLSGVGLLCEESRMSDQSDDSADESQENDVDVDLMSWDDRGADDDREIGGEH
jgi:hypothetical protein